MIKIKTSDMFIFHKKPAIPFSNSRLTYFASGEKPSVQSESADQPKLSLNDTQTFEGRKKIATEAGKKIQELTAKGDSEKVQTLKQLLQEYYASGRNQERAKETAQNLFQKLSATPKLSASGIILMDSPFSALSEMNSKIPSPKLS